MTIKRIALFISTMGSGGAERVALSLAKGFVQKGHSVDLILVNADGPLLEEVYKGVKIIDLKKNRTFSSIYCLAKYLRKNKYDTLISFMNHANTCALISAKLAFFNGKIVVTEHSSITSSLINQQGFKNRIILLLMRYIYRYADHVIAVSEELAMELKSYLKLPNISFIFNPIDIKDEENHTDLIPFEWTDSTQPLIIGVGRLTTAKSFDLLIRSFKDVNNTVPSRLIILGEGDQRDKLEKLIEELKLKNKVLLPGLVSNPHVYMKNAKVFVLSSSWEGFGLVIAEALALGITVVSTDCHSGPSEILEQGKWGYLVPVNDQQKLNEAIILALTNPLNPDKLKERARLFSIENITGEYLEKIFPN